MRTNNTLTFFLSFLSILLIISLTASYQTINHMNDTIAMQREEIEKEKEIVEEKTNRIESLEESLREKRMDIKEISEKMDLLVTFKDAGFNGQSVSDIRELLKIAKKVPYGSPFQHGHYFTSFYGKRDELNFGGSPNGHHGGVDIRPKERNDTVVKATADGSVVDFGISETLGKYIIFETKGGYRLKYGHLKTIFWQDVDTQTVKNIPVEEGDKLGVMGSTGSWSTGPHLHLEIHYKDSEKGEYVELNPRRIIEYIGGSKKNLKKMEEDV